MVGVIHVDFIFARLCRDISRWYDKYYFGTDVDQRKSVHLTIMEEKYAPTRFSSDPVKRDEQIGEFLTMVQRNVDGYNF